MLLKLSQPILLNPFNHSMAQQGAEGKQQIFMKTTVILDKSQKD